MPFLSLPGSVRMFYEVLSDPLATDNADLVDPATPLLDPSKPTLVTLVPFYAVQASALPQIDASSPLRKTHNIVAFSPRSHGRTVSEAKPQHDALVSAADLAFAFEALQLPPSQIYAPGSICGRIAIAFATMFPAQVTAIVVLGASALSALTTTEGFEMLDSTMFNPLSLEDLHEIMGELAMQLMGRNAKGDQVDDFVNLLLRRHNPRHCSKSYELCRLSYLGMPLTPEAVAKVKAPVLLLHGENDEYSSPAHALTWRELLMGSSEVAFHIIPDASHVAFLSEAEPALSHMTSFLSRHTPSSPLPIHSPDFALALRTCSEMAQNPKILVRNPRNPESYSALSTEEREKCAVDLAKMARYEAEWSARPLADGAEGLEPWQDASAGRIPRQRWRWSRRNDAPSSSPRASQRYSIASEVAVQIISSETVVQVTSEQAIRPFSLVESKVLPAVTPEEDEDALSTASDDDSDDDSEDFPGRKDSGFVDALTGDEHNMDKKEVEGVVESMSRLAFQRHQRSQGSQ
ncbi:hypothetical protein JCM10207_000531 [Rhodosporidiobolus poonsookiae]